MSICCCLSTRTLFLFVINAYFVAVQCDKYKVCVIDGHGSFKRIPRYCPTLRETDSKVECVLGVDRLDCLRKISKAKADFSVFTAEDLLTAANSAIEVLLTNQVRYTEDEFEYKVVAVINEGAGIKSKHDLYDKKLCHPGYGYITDWTRIISNYLETSVVPQTCKADLTFTENRIKASSEFFQSACKAGPWVSNPEQDRKLKKKYSKLCGLCNSPEKCAMDDKYWGRTGSLLCLTDGAGDISWARLDDVQRYFGITPGNVQSSPEGFKLLCPDGSTKPINSTNPCVWVVKPWPVIATRREIAQEIQHLVSTLSYDDSRSWQAALLDLLEFHHSTLPPFNPLQSIEGYLDQATGFLSANSFTGCHTPRTVKICTTSNIEYAKCRWLRESATVYGIEPDVDCIKAENKTQCMEAVNNKFADLVMIPPDLLHTAVGHYKLKNLFYETTDDDNKYITVPLVLKESDIKSLKDLQGRKSCFPTYDGVAWNSVIHTLSKYNLFTTCSHSSDEDMANFFGPSCVPDIPKNVSSKMSELCIQDNYKGELGAIKCLKEGKGEVAFVSKNSLTRSTTDSIIHDLNLNEDDIRIICAGQPCHLSWSPLGHAMVRSNSSELWLRDALDAFLQLDLLFGKIYTTPTKPFTLFGPYDGQYNVLFHDATVAFRSVPTSRNLDTMERQYESVLSNYTKCNSAIRTELSFSLVLVLCFVFMFKYYK